jgi:hypothetical protein
MEQFADYDLNSAYETVESIESPGIAARNSEKYETPMSK